MAKCARPRNHAGVGALAVEEKRQTIRHRVLKGGHVVFNDGRSTISCIARDMSDIGAKLRFETVIGVPGRFTLVLHDGSRHACVVRWRTANELGVEFERPGGPREDG